jgi:signal transduction histidine kinase
MMLGSQSTVERSDILTLWSHLLNELIDVFDAHGVCAAVASALAPFSSSTAVVAINDPLGENLDVWVCSEEGLLRQIRWRLDKAKLAPFDTSDHIAFVKRYHLPAEDLEMNELWQLADKSILAAPIPYPAHQNPITAQGGIYIIDPSLDCPITMDNIGLLASQVTILLDRAFLRRRSVQQSVEFGIVSDIGISLTSTLEMEKVIHQVTDNVRRAIGADSISVGLTDPVNNDIVFVEPLTGARYRSLPIVRLKIGQGIPGWVALHGEPAIVNDAYADKRFFSQIDRDTGYLTNSILCVPIKIEQRVIGVLEASNKQNGYFDDNDSRLLQAICGPLAVAIENARLHADVLAEKRRVETIFASMSEGLLTVNGAGEITAANDALMALMRNDDSDLVGRNLADVIKTRPSEFTEFLESVIEASEDFPQIACDLRQKNKGWVPVLISGTTISQDDGKVGELIFVFSDLSQIREVERMRDDFFHNIVHELRTPLATILMYARLLREGKADRDQSKAGRFLGVIEKESDRLQKMVRQMLELSKLESSEFQRGSGSAMLNPVFDQLLPPLSDRALEKGLIFKNRVQDDLPAVAGNEDTLYMIFKNLVENAIKFTPVGTVSIEAQALDGQVRIDVVDEGIGIPAEALPNLFRRFYRAQTAVERGIAGTGLGLYMVKEALDHHGGSVNVNSTKDKGTTFTVHIPVAGT